MNRKSHWLQPSVLKKAFAAALLLSCQCLTGCAESSFELAKDSRLPRWFSLQAGLTRSDVTLTMDYYISWIGKGRTARLTLRDSHEHRLASKDGTLAGMMPIAIPGIGDGTYPSYELITVNGVSEVIEHRRMEPVFYLTDDPRIIEAVKAKATAP